MSLTVCWRLPHPLPSRGTPVLSFLPPADEERLDEAIRGSVIRARVMSAEARQRARGLFMGAVAAIGSAADENGGTFREELGRGEGFSLWWLHNASFKDCEADPAFDAAIALEAIREVARNAGEGTLELWGAPPGLARALSVSYKVRSFLPQRRSSRLRLWLRGFAARAVFTVRMALRAAAARFSSAPSDLDIAIFGFWDWSVFPGKDGELKDRYLGTTPGELKALGKVAWLAWPDPEGRPGGGLAAPLPRDGRVVPLTRFITWADIAAAAWDYSPLISWLRWRKKPGMYSALRREGWDMRGIFEETLLRGFLDTSMPRAELIRRAARRAARKLKPRALLSFLEFHPSARAVYAGVRASSPATLLVAVQHASIAPEKTFYYYEPSELRGTCPLPVADMACAMGEFGAEVFRQAKIPRVVVTGTPRYDWLRSSRERPRRAEGPWRVLVACGQFPQAEAELVEAVVLACRGLSLELLVRDHPILRTSEEPRLAGLAGEYRVSDKTLAEDMAWADLAIFSHSTVAEEAVMAGVPAWQWRRLGPDLSALAAETVIPRFQSVAELRAALQNFTPGQGLPKTAELRHIESRLFHILDGLAGVRVAAAVGSALRGPD